MANLSEGARRITTFLLSIFLWLHALFFLNIHSALLSKFTQLLRLTSSEIVLFALLVTFSLFAASGFWRTVLSLLYIYFFPFVLLGYAFYLVFLLLRGINRWFMAQTPLEGGSLIAKPDGPTIIPEIAASSQSKS